MMGDLVSVIKEIIRDELRNVQATRLAVVERGGLHPHSDSADDDNYSCDVRLKNSGLLLKQVPVTTGHIGSAAIPNENDLVLVAFEQGDVNQPIIVGRLYNDEDRPPLNHDNELVMRLPLSASDDETVLLQLRNRQDETPTRQLRFEMLPKILSEINDDQIIGQVGDTRVSLNQTGRNDGIVEIEAGQSRITINQDGNIAIESGGDISLSTTTGDLTLEAANVSIKSKLQTNVEAGTAVEVKGTQVKIQGVTSFDP